MTHAKNPSQHPAITAYDDNATGSSGLLFEQAMAQTRMAVCLSDPKQPDNPIVFANRAFHNLTGYDESEVLGRNCRFLQGADTSAEALDTIRRTIAEEDVCVVELINYRKDGTPFWNALHLGPIYRPDGTLRYFFGSQWNVTDVHAARAGEQHARILSRELSHRVKNMFSVISGIVTLTARHERAPKVAEKINQRIRALGRAYEATLDDAEARSVAVDKVIELVLKPYAAAGNRIETDGPDIKLEPSMVSVLGIILHELATNAVKYGALSAEGGRIRIAWRREEADVLTLYWREDGGPAVSGQTDAGMGRGIIQALLTGAKGTIDYQWEPQGLEARLRLPVREVDV